MNTVLTVGLMTSGQTGSVLLVSAAILNLGGNDSTGPGWRWESRKHGYSRLNLSLGDKEPDRGLYN